MLIGNRIGILVDYVLVELLLLKLNVKHLYAFFCTWNLLLNFLHSAQGLHESIRKFIILGVCSYQGKVRPNLFLLPFQFNVAHFFQRASNDFIVLQAAAVSLKDGRKKFSCLAWRGVCSAQSFPDERICFKKELLCKLHLNYCNQHTFKSAELKSALISCCFLSLTYVIVPVGF